MIRWIVGTSLHFRFIIVAFGLGLTYFGAQRLKEIPIDVFPEFAPARVEVQTLCIGLSAAEVEEQVTVPIENAMNGVPGVEILRSSSVPQLSSVVAIFERGADELAARQLVAERVAIATRGMPTWAAPPVMMPPVSSTSRVMKIGVTTKDRSQMDLSMLASGISGRGCSPFPAWPMSRSGVSGRRCFRCRWIRTSCRSTT
jgi:Cu/Ag efflux pump CusA